MDSNNHRSSEGHPDVDELSAYRRHELDDPRRLEIQRHLIDCPECTELLLDLAAFPEVPLRHGRQPLSTDQQAEDWLAIERRIFEETGTGVEERADAAGMAHLSTIESSAFTPATLLAAGFALASIGLAVLAFQLAERLEEAQRLIRPTIAATESHSLTPMAETTRRVDGDPSVEIAHDGASLSLYLVTTELDELLVGEDISFRATLSHLETGGEWTTSGLQPDDMGGFSITLDRTRLPPGDFRLQLQTVAGAQRKPIASYRFHLTVAEATDLR